MFDVSHMGQIKLTGQDRERFIERVSVGDIKGMETCQLREN
jgi:glycine cleavage system aminomethyltransferase T